MKFDVYRNQENKSISVVAEGEWFDVLLHPTLIRDNFTLQQDDAGDSYYEIEFLGGTIKIGSKTLDSL